MYVYKIETPNGMFIKFDATLGWVEDEEGDIYNWDDADSIVRNVDEVKHCEIVQYILERVDGGVRSWLDSVNYIRDEFCCSFEQARESLLLAHEMLEEKYSYNSTEVRDKAIQLLDT